jgi:hypothetical protein
MLKLSNDLLPIYELELARGNDVVRIDEPAGTNCPYAVIFRRPLHRDAIENELALPPSIQYWESRDAHYAREAGFYSEETRHVIAGPLAEQ